MIRLDLCGEHVTRSLDKNAHRFRRKTSSQHHVMGIINESTVKTFDLKYNILYLICLIKIKAKIVIIF